ncbi:SCP2 sterol-binding domain-containing protein [Tepidicaulis sp. LMO-SS28]|uniref:SCP2 sterol-binding domain-containing protein n=1 Tax=Tepidicaulis sp. LMO-SS28 TaxID=3447455 RepID=UPI003EE37D38
MQETISDKEIVADITALLKAAFHPEDDLGARLKFDYGAAGVVMIDGTKQPNEIHNRNEPADCTVALGAHDHWRMLKLELDQAHAFRQGRMRISGDPIVPLRLGPIVTRHVEPSQ